MFGHFAEAVAALQMDAKIVNSQQNFVGFKVVCLLGFVNLLHVRSQKTNLKIGFRDLIQVS